MSPKRPAVGSPATVKSPATAASTPQSPRLNIFAGHSLVFWATMHMKIMQQRVQDFGGTLQKELTAATTHIVCPPHLTAKEAAVKLAGWNGPSMEVHVGQPATFLRVPQHAVFVTTDWVSRSIGRQALQPAEEYLPPGLKPAPHPPVRTQQQQQQQQQQQSVADEPGHQPQPAAEPAHLPAPRPASSTATIALTDWQLTAAQQDVLRRVQCGDPPCRVERRGSEFVAVSGVKPTYTGGSTGIPWGSCGVWDEPVDEEGARDTFERLKAFWYHTGGQPVSPVAALPAAAASGNPVCSHVACSQRSFCIVSGLEDVRKAYVASRGVDQFKIKAIDKGISQLIRCRQPLDTDEDVERVPHLGKKTILKVQEILHTGTSSRVTEAAADGELQVLNLFMEVWGVGDKTAERWYSLGCRTLDDLRARSEELNLTSLQEVGLKYFDDLQRKIPREEVARVEATVRQACFDLVERWEGYHRYRDVEFTFCQATGSYRRGAPLCGDIDMLTCLPPSLRDVDPQAFLKELIGSLLSKGLLLAEKAPTRDLPHLESSATWCGLCRPHDSHCVRRIDLKVYDPTQAPYALAYFGSSQSFCRALRYWATYNTAHLAKRYNPIATGFKLSDSVLHPMYRRWHPEKKRNRRRNEPKCEDGEPPPKNASGHHADDRLLQPLARCADETSIFRELGLSFVPPSMRVLKLEG